MTKRELLLSKGYKNNFCKYRPNLIDYSFFKTIDGINIEFELCINIETNERILIRSQSHFCRQEDIDELQRVFNTLQSDFEEMQQYED